MTAARIPLTLQKLLRLVTATSLVVGLAGSAWAEEDVNAPKLNPVGTSSSWSTDVNGTGTSGIVLDEQQLAIVARINAYFNTIGDLQGTFRQTDAQGAESKGKFYLRRPGKFRFVYSPPSKMVVLSDGENLSFEDHDINSADRYPLDSTPFRVLVSKDVDLTRDASILELTETPSEIVVTLQDKADDSTGKIRVFFTVVAEGLVLKEWIITGPSGGDTRVQLASLEQDAKLEDKLFQPTPFMPVVDSGGRR
jgi:outer membrane lipoprotein-sorting protein